MKAKFGRKSSNNKVIPGLRQAKNMAKGDESTGLRFMAIEKFPAKLMVWVAIPDRGNSVIGCAENPDSCFENFNILTKLFGVWRLPLMKEVARF